MITTTSRIARALVVAILASVLSLPAHAHDTMPAATQQAVTTTGTVTELIVDNRLTGTTLRYVGLKLDDGRSVALAGADVGALPTGARIDATGTLNGTTLQVSWITPAASPGTARAAVAGVPTTLAGSLAIFHMDYFAEGRGVYGLAVRDAAGKATVINVAAIPDAIAPNMLVSVAGTLATDGQSVDAQTLTILAAAPAQAPSDPLQAPTTHNVLVIPLSYLNATGSTTAAAIQTEFQNNVAPYYNEVSYGQHLLNITVACKTTTPAGCSGKTDANGYLQAQSAMPGGCPYDTMFNTAKSLASAAGYSTAIDSTHFIYVMLPAGAGCGWAGLAYVGYGEAFSADYNALWVYGHELGHNFGLWHAGSTRCAAGTVVGTGCSVNEYGDPFVIMGNIRTGHFSAMQKSALGWIPSTSVKTQTSGTQTYQLSPIEVGGQSTYAVKIPTSNSNRTYWVEYRQPVGTYDAFLSGLPNLGAQVRVQSPFESMSGTDDTQFLDMTQGTSGYFDDGTLLPTAPSFVDSSTGVTITVNSATPGSSGLLSVTVAMGGGGKSNSTTTLASSANPSTYPASVTITATVTGSAPTGSVAFTDGGASIAGCTTVTLSSGMAACTPPTLSVGTHNIVATYSGDSANNGSTSSTLAQAVNSAPGSLVNGGFEVPGVGSGFQYVPTGAGVGWTFAGGAGVQGNGSAWGAASAPEGTQTAFIQSTGSFSQSVNLNAGSYSIGFKVAQRAYGVAPYTQPIRVSVDGVPIGPDVIPPGTSFTPAAINFTVASPGVHTITFAGTIPADNSTFIDAISIDVPTTSSLVNAGFETPAVGASFQYAPSGAGIGWTFAGGAGVQGNGSAWGAASAPEGTQTAFIQSTGSFSQSVNLDAGSYSIGFRVAQRAYGVAPYTQPIRVSVDGVPIGADVTPSGTSFTPAAINFTVASPGAHTITFAGTELGDKSTFIDAITIDVPTSSLINASFETPAEGASFQYAPSGAGIGWTFSGGSGIQGNGSAWGAAVAPLGTQTAFIQGVGAMSQTLTLAAGNYTLGFKAAQRLCCSAPFVHPIAVMVDGVQVGTNITPSSASFASFSVPIFISIPGDHTITLMGLDSSDNSVFVDAFTLN